MLRITMHIVPIMTNTVFILKLSYFFILLILVVIEIWLPCPIRVTEKWLLCPIHVTEEKWLL